MSRDRDIKSIQFQIKNLVTSIDELKLEIVDATDEGELTSLKNVSETHSKKVDTIEEKIISYDITDHAEFTTELATIRRNWRSNMREIAKRLNEIQKARESNNVDPKSINSANLNTLTRPKLPTLNLPTFDGNLGEYLSFWESFNTNIQSRTDLDKLDKFKYFQSLIKGKPLEFINGYTVSAANYDNMIEAFEKKFKKIDQLVYLYINNILNIYPIKKRNAQQLQQLVNVIRTSLNNLKALDQKVEDWDAILNKIVLDKLDVDTLERWQMHHIDHQIPKFETLIEFLEKIADSQTTLQPQNIQISQVTFKQVNKQTCPCCRGDHPLFLCTNFQALDVHKRQQKVRAEKLCYNCLSKFHSLPTCQSKKTCKLCQKRHNTLLHIDNYANKFNNKQTSGKPTIENSSNHQSSNKVEATQTTIQSSVTHSNNLSVILPTVLISILDDNQLITARALIDTGSQSTCISESLAQKMTNTRHAITVQISGIVANSTSIIKQAIAIKFCPIKDPAICFDTEALILPKLHSPFPDVSFSTQDDAFIRKLSLADPTFNQALPIDVLIGGKLACDILIGGQRLDSPDRSLSAVNTLFGWVIMGNYHPNQHFPGTIYSYLTVRNPPSDLIGKLWELEDIPISNKVLSPQDKLSEKILSESLTTLTSGRFSVDLIFENYPPKLGESFPGAAKRFSLLEKRFQKNPDFKLQYTKAFQEYMVLGQMEAITNLSFDIPHYYIPHHPVLKTSSLTTKLRIVFDGSFLSSNGKSLNQNLFTGPTLQQDIRHLLMGFRLYKYVISADLQQMYRQILINSHHRDFLRVLWRNDEKEPLRHYRLTTVPFGLTCSPFSAIRVLHHVADQNEQMYPHAAKVIRQNFYVDDLLVGANSEEELFKLIKEVVIILEQAKFKFDKWASNSPELLKSLRDIGLSTDSHASRTLISSANTLGIQWNIQQDQFQFPIEFQIKTSLTKRILLSSLAKIYDPLGFLSPCVLLLKIMMQKAWLLKLSWDTKLPEEHQNLWLEMVDNIVRYFHNKLNHGDFSILSAHIRSQYWIIKLRHLIRVITHQCPTCRLFKTKRYEQLMSDLPTQRVVPSRPFSRVGIDCAGPFFVTPVKTRRSSYYKYYICLYICFSTRAVHIDYLSAMNTDSFLMSFNRFISRRGCPQEVFSDNGTNFVGSYKELKETSEFLLSFKIDPKISQHAQENHIKWHFNPPYAPSFGGLWEAGIKSLKSLLKRTYKDLRFTLEEFETILAKIEAILNSRPLYPLSDNLDDLEALTPGHFLIGDALTTVPEHDLTDINISRLSRWQLVQNRVQVIWNKWSKDYLHSLQQRRKWFTPNNNPAVGQLVLLCESSNPLQWHKGRILKLYPGPDNLTRVVLIKTSVGEYTRALSKLAPLLIDKPPSKNE